MKMEGFHDKLKWLIHTYVLLTYIQTKKYPPEELYGLTSQDRRAAVSTMLNYIEGYVCMRSKVMISQAEIAFASLKESIYARFLAKELKYITAEEYLQAFKLKEEIAPMLYKTIERARHK